MTIYQGFAEGLDELDRTIVSDMQVSTPSGRGYKNQDSVYHESVHLRSICVEEEDIVELQKKFRDNAACFDGAVYAGAAGLVNLSYMAAARPAAGILFDVNFLQKPFWDITIQALAENPEVEGFRDFLIHSPPLLRKKIKGLFNTYAGGVRKEINPSALGLYNCDYKTMELANEEYLAHWLEEGETGLFPDRTWLKSGYEHLHQMAKHKALGAITLDVNDEAAARQLKDYLDRVRYRVISNTAKSDTPEERQGNAAVKLLHISNIFLHINKDSDWTRRALTEVSVEKARANLEQFTVSEPVVIDDMASETWPQYGRSL